MESHEPLLDADEAAARLKVKRGTVYDWASRGLLPHIRILAGQRRPVIRFREADLAAFLTDRSVTPATDIEPTPSST